MAEFSIRTASKDDLAAIRALIHAVRINPTGISWRHFLVAVGPGNGLVGCGQIKVHADGSRELASIAVKPEFRGQGAARALIEGLLERERFRPIYLMCRTELKTLYTKFGFQPVKTEDLPLYFQRIKRFERIFNAMAKPDNRLLIMQLD